MNCLFNSPQEKGLLCRFYTGNFLPKTKQSFFNSVGTEIHCFLLCVMSYFRQCPSLILITLSGVCVETFPVTPNTMLKLTT